MRSSLPNLCAKNLVPTARLVDCNEVMGMKCCNGNSNEGMNMRIGNKDSFVWCAWLKNGNGR